MSFARLAAALTICASAAQAQDLLLFDPETFGQAVLSRKQAALPGSELEVQVGSYNNEFISNYGDRSVFARTGRAVGRLDILTDKGHAPCTAFLVEGNQLLTNHHCVPGLLDNEALGASAIIAVQLRMGYLRDGIEEGTRAFHVNPVPVETNKALDYSVLQIVGGDANAEFGALELSAALPSDRDPLWVIGHPLGEAQRISREKCQADSPAVASGRLRHTCDTLPGNSGSPVIDTDRKQVVALHHAGSRAGEVNYAIPMSEILAQSKVLKTAVPVTGQRVVGAERQQRAAEADGALAAALALLDVSEKIGALEALTTGFEGTRAAATAALMLPGLIQERDARQRLRAADAALKTAMGQSDPEARIAALEEIVGQFPDTSAAATAQLALQALSLAAQPAAPVSKDLALSTARERCVLQAASPYDMARPDHIPAVAFEKIDTETALRLCRASETQVSGSAAASFALARALEASGAYAEARSYYAIAQKAGHVAATTALGRFARDGKGGKADVDEAIRLFESAADAGDPVAMTLLAEIYTLSGGLTRRDYGAAQRHLERAVALDHPQAVYALANAYRDSTLFPRNNAEYVRLLRRASELGETRAQIDLAQLYWDGLRGAVDVDLDKGMALMTAAAESGVPKAQVLIGLAHLRGKTDPNGHDIEKDATKALRWLAQAAEGGYVNAQMTLGRLFEKGGDGIEPDLSEALRWYELAAKQDFVRGLVAAAEMYEAGVGTEADPEKAARYWVRSVRRGHKQPLTRNDWPRDTALEVQRLLRDEGFYDGALDGAFGAGSKAAFNAYFDKSWRNQTYDFPESSRIPEVNAGWYCQC